MSENTKKLKLMRDVLGAELYQAVAEQGLGLVHISNFGNGFISKEERDSAILRDFYNGMDLMELSQKYKIKSTSIYKITESKVKESS